LLVIVFPVMVSYSPPSRSTPTPTAGAMPAAGALALLLPVIWLCAIRVQERVVLPGQRPSCGGGASSLLSELGAIPVRLLSKTESRMIRRPPELVP
jgi:hypothetical protein